MKLAFYAAALAAFAFPALALADEMDPTKLTCGEFMAGDMEAMSAQMDAMHMASPDAAMEVDDAAMEEMMHGVVEHCEGKPDMMAMEAMMMK